jgi:aspartate/methionine/tyrosine aminotransferase
VTRPAATLAPARRLAAIPRSGIRAVLERAAGADVVDLASGDPSFPTPAHDVAAAADAAARGDTHYTVGTGTAELRAALAAALARDHGIDDVDGDREVVVTAGALNALAGIFLTLLDPGDEVLVPDPGFANYAAQVTLAGGRAVPVPASAARGWAIDVDELRARLTPRSRAIVVNSPCNPTGAVLDAETAAAIVRLAEEHELALISDEAYEHVVFAPAVHRPLLAVPGARERTVTILSVSKTFAMTGWRIGFAVAPPPIAQELAKVQEHVVGCPSSVSQAAARAALEGPAAPAAAMALEYRRRRDLVVDALAELPGVALVPPDGALYAFPRIESLGPEPALALADAGVLVVPGEAFGAQGKGHVRISFAGATPALERGLERLRAAVAA